MIDILIIGAGPAGLTAAIYARRAGFSATVLEGEIYGGQTASTPVIENYPGFFEIGGVEFAMKLYEQARALGADILFERVTAVSLDGADKQVTTAENSYSAKSVIIAGGAKRAKLHVPGEDRLSGRGVSWCATCDGALYRGREVAVIGGGNTALEDAVYLSNICKAVHLIHRRGEYRAQKHLVLSMREHKNIIEHLGYTVSEIVGESSVEGLTLRSTEGEADISLPVAGVFVAVGTKPDNGLYSSYCPLDEVGYFLAPETCTTPTGGVFVAGDCRKKLLRQIVTATSDGAVAVSSAAMYLNSH